MVKILRPDGTQLGPFMMAELPVPFTGVYYYDLATTTSDLEGEWLAIIVPVGAPQSFARIPLYLRPDLSSEIASLNDLILQLQMQIAEIGDQVTQIGEEVSQITNVADDLESTATDLETIADQLQITSNSIISAVVPAFIEGAVQEIIMIKGEVVDNSAIIGEVQIEGTIIGVVEDEGEI